MKALSQFAMGTVVAAVVLVSTGCVVERGPDRREVRDERWCLNHPNECDHERWCADHPRQCSP